MPTLIFIGLAKVLYNAFILSNDIRWSHDQMIMWLAVPPPNSPLCYVWCLKLKRTNFRKYLFSRAKKIVFREYLFSRMASIWKFRVYEFQTLIKKNKKKTVESRDIRLMFLLRLTERQAGHDGKTVVINWF